MVIGLRIRRTAALAALGMVSTVLVATAVDVSSAYADPVISTGLVSTLVGSGATAVVPGSGASAAVNAPDGLTYAGGAVYTAGTDYIAKVLPSTRALTVFAGTAGAPGCVNGATGSSSSFTNVSDLAADATWLYSIGNCGLRRTSLATGATSAVPGAPGSVMGVAAANSLLYLTTSGGSVYSLDPGTGVLTLLTTLQSGGVPSTVSGITADATYAYVLALDGAAIRAVRLSDGAASSLLTDSRVTPTHIFSAGAYLYISAVTPDGSSGPILRRVSKSDGSWIAVAGAGTGFAEGIGTDAWFATVAGVTSDGTSLYVADTGNNRIRQVGAAAGLPVIQPVSASAATTGDPGSLRTVAGSGAATTTTGVGTGASFKSPSGVTILGHTAYVGEADAVSAVDLGTGAVRILTGQPGTAGCVSASSGAAALVQGVGNLDTDGHYLYGVSACGLLRIDPASGATSILANVPGSRVKDATVGPDGFLYSIFGFTGAMSVYRIDPTSGVSTLWVTLPQPSGPFSCGQTSSITSDSSSLYVSLGGYNCDTLNEAGRFIDRVTVATKAVTQWPNDSLLQLTTTISSVGDSIYAAETTGALVRFPKALPAPRTVITPADVADIATDGRAVFVVGTTSNLLQQVTVIKNPLAAGGPSLPGETVGLGAMSQPTTTCSCADPVNTATGAFTESMTDLSLPGRGPGVNVTRSYDSGLAGSTGRFGYGWTDNYAMSVQVDPNGGTAPLATSPVVDVVQENGSRLAFVRDSSGNYSAASRVLATLVHNGDGTFTFTRARHDQYTFSAAGLLTRVTDLNGYHTDLSYDGTNRLLTATDSAARVFTFAYNASGLVSGVTDTAGRQASYSYDTAGNLTSATEPTGAVGGFGYDSAHRLTTVTDPRGHATTNAYDWAGHVASQTDRMGRTTTFSYSVATEPLDWTLTVTDPRGNSTRLAYTDGELQTKTAGVGTAAEATWSYSYDPITNATTLTTDPLGHTRNATYNADGNALTATDGLGHTQSWTYNSLDEPLTHTDRNGVTTTNTYDSAGNLLTTGTPLVGSSPAVSATTTLTYGDNAHPGDVTAVTNPRGKTSSRVFDAYGQQTSATDPLGRTSTSSYTCTPAGPGCRSNIGWVYRTVSPKGNAAGGIPADYTTTVTRDDDGRVLTSTDPLAHTTTRSYDNDGNVAAVTDPNNHTTSYAYNFNNQLTTVTRPDTTTLATGYDVAGNMTSQANGAGKTTTYTYDPLNRLATSTDPLNRVTTYQYDLASRLTSTVDPANRTTSSVYDNADRRTSTTYSDGSTPNVTYAYDNNGARTAMTDGTGTTSYTLDSLGRLTSTTNGAGRTISYGYDLNGNRTAITYAAGQTANQVYDDANELTSITDWASHLTTFSYDPDGNQQSTGYANGVIETTTVNKAAQVTAVADTQGATSLASYTYTRDPNGLLASTTPTGTTGQTNETYGHSTLDQLTTFTTTASNGAYGYDSADNLTGLANGTQQAFDNANQLTTTSSPISLVGTAKAGDSGTTSSLTLTLPTETAANDQILLSATMAQSKNVTTPTGYTLVGTYTSGTTATSVRMVLFRRLAAAGDTTITVAFGTKFAKTATLAVYRGVHPTSPIDVSSSGLTATGTTVTAPAVTTTQPAERLVVFDGENNTLTAPTWTVPTGMTSQASQTGGTTVAAAIADSTQAAAGSTGSRTSTLSAPASLVSALIALKPAPTSYTYNTLGSRTTITPPVGAATTLGYDQAQRLKTYGTTASYAYNGDGLRTSKTVNATTTPYTWDLAAGLPLLLADGTNNYLYGPAGQLVEQITAANVATYIQHDQQGSTRLLTSQTGAITGTYTYDPYGRLTSHTGTASSPLLYTGQLNDTESGLYYLRARYYDPTTAQFLTRDPLEAQTRSPYGYVNGDPLDGADPTGLDAWDDAGNWAAGFGDTITFGGTKQIRRLINYEVDGDMGDMVDHCSDYYAWGGHGGAIASIGVGGAEYLSLRAARAVYVAAVAEIPAMFDSAEVAVMARNLMKIGARQQMPSVLRDLAAARNMLKYLDPIGPTYASLLAKYGGDAQRVLQAAGRTSGRINRFFLL